MLLAAAAMPGLALRPQHSNSASFARLAESLRIGVTDKMTFLKDASSVVNDVLLQAGNATEHLTDQDKELLEQVKTIIKDDLYGNMRNVQMGDESDLMKLWENILYCNTDIEARQSSTGDLGTLHQEAVQMQKELNRLQGIVDKKTSDNDTYWGEFDQHMQTILDAPECPPFPDPRGMAQFDAYFKISLYSAWWTAAQSPYHSHRDRFLHADEALRKAIAEYNVQKASLGVKYCDYKVELEAACDSYEQCYASAVTLYNARVAGVKIRVAQNLEIVKAAETLLAQVRFLLAQQQNRETPPYDTSEWQVTYKAVPAKTLCDKGTLTASTWDPPIKCGLPTPWVLGETGESCESACESRGYSCTSVSEDEQTNIEAIDVDAKLHELSGGQECSKSYNNWPGYSPYFLPGKNWCVAHSGHVGQPHRSSCREKDEDVQRLCFCEAQV